MVKSQLVWGYESKTDYFTITGSKSVTPKWSTGDVTSNPLEYKLGDGEWINAVSGLDIRTDNDTIQFRGTGRTGLFINNDSTNKWIIEGADVVIDGNFNALLDYQDPPSFVTTFAFAYMFYEQDSIKNVNAKLPATTLDYSCYHSMFYRCTNLVNTPALPATTLVSGCYSFMFGYCTNLVNAPLLPATNLVFNCYDEMFRNCNSLKTASNSDVYTTLKPVQADMFSDCTSLMEPVRYCAIPVDWGGPNGGCPEFFTITGSASVVPRWTTAGNDLQYKLGDNEWIRVRSGSALTTGDVIQFRGLNRTGLFTSGVQSNIWTIDGSNVSLSGNINSLLDYNVENIELGDHAFSFN